MAITARTWVEGEVATAAKFNTIRDDILELNAVAGFFNSQWGTVTLSQGETSEVATVSTMSARAVLHFGGASQNYIAGNIGVWITRISATQIQVTRSGSDNTMVVAFCIEDPRG